MSKRRTHSPEFKAKVAMEAISGRKTIQEIADDHAIIRSRAPGSGFRERNRAAGRKEGYKHAGLAHGWPNGGQALGSPGRASIAAPSAWIRAGIRRSKA